MSRVIATYEDQTCGAVRYEHDDGHHSLVIDGGGTYHGTPDEIDALTQEYDYCYSEHSERPVGDNGVSGWSLDEMIHNYDSVVNLMGDDIRERVHGELAPCTRRAFLEAYLEEHYEEFGERLIVN